MVARKIIKSTVGNYNRVFFLRNLKGGTINLSQLPNEWKEYVDEKFRAQGELLTSLPEDVRQIVYSAVVSGMENVATKIAHERCLHDKNIDRVEDIAVSLDEMKQHEEEIFDNILNILNKGQLETNKRIAALQELNEQLQFNTRKAMVYYEEILAEIRLGKERIDEIIILEEGNSIAIGDIKEDIKDLKTNLENIIFRFIQLSEKRHEEYQSARALIDKEFGKISSLGLDGHTISEMRGWLQGLSKKNKSDIEKSIKQQGDNLSKELLFINENLKDIASSLNSLGRGQELTDGEIKRLSQKAEEILQREVKLYGLALDTNQTTHQTYEKTQEIFDYLKDILVPVADLEEIWRKVLQNTNGPEEEKYKQKLNEKICKLQQSAKAMELQLQIAAQEGGAVEEACPYCGYVELRGIVGDKCQCDCCGKTFNRKDVNLKEVDEWRQRHTAKLENVYCIKEEDSSKTHYFCRMKLDQNTVSHKGVLIIPSIPPETTVPETTAPKVWFGDKLTLSDGKVKIAFCKPNIDDEVGLERMRRIKTLILPSNIFLTKFNDAFPFSEGIDDLEMVLRFDEKEKKCTLDKETLKQIKKESV